MHELIGVGFGPSNLALAIALEDELGSDTGRSRTLFLEKQETSRWHPGLMLPGATLQVSFLKDLVTLRDPTSPYTFLNYLKQQGRLDTFVNLRTFFPSRNEFGHYVAWVGQHFAPMVRYGDGVKIVTPLRHPPRGAVVALGLETESGQTYECRNLVVASGGRPSIPQSFKPILGPRVFHSSEYLMRIPPIDQLDGATVAVVGSGQSAGEVLHHLLTNASGVELVSIIKDFTLRPMDDSKLVNEVFMPHIVDFTYNLPKLRREEFLESVKLSNYSAVDIELIDELYRLLYEEQVSGRRPLRFVTHCFIEAVEASGDDITIRWRNRMTGEKDEIRADYVVLGTGFEYADVPEYLRPLVRFMEHKEGHPLIRRDYRLECREGFEPHLYVQGFAERTHGISDTLLSMAAHRAGIIASQLAPRIREALSEAEAITPAAVAIGNRQHPIPVDGHQEKEGATYARHTTRSQ